jgi:hypothetical protein
MTSNSYVPSLLSNGSATDHPTHPNSQSGEKSIPIHVKLILLMIITILLAGLDPSILSSSPDPANCDTRTQRQLDNYENTQSEFLTHAQEYPQILDNKTFAVDHGPFIKGRRSNQPSIFS